MTGRLPNFCFIGPDKAGSTWLHEVLIVQPDVYLSPAKDLYFFDRYYDRGPDWYRRQFAAAGPEHRVVGEVCQDYLFHPEAARRIRDTLGPDVRLMVTAREPAARAFSSYLYMLKQGQQPGSFRAALDGRPELLDHGRYGTGLRRFLEVFDRPALHVAVFDDLVDDPQAFVDAVADWLGIGRFTLDPSQLAARLPASRARSTTVARAARGMADWAREHDRAGLVGAVKRSPLTQRVLYKQLEQRPTLSEEDAAYVRERLEPEIVEVESTFGLHLRERWGWTTAS
jgi:hypothetical protein